jgi:hypothetical protein
MGNGFREAARREGAGLSVPANFVQTIIALDDGKV